MIVRWKIFETSEECEKWQETNPQFVISTMQPIVRLIDHKGWEGQISEFEKNTTISSAPAYVVFVTFFERPKTISEALAEPPRRYASP